MTREGLDPDLSNSKAQALINLGRYGGSHPSTRQRPQSIDEHSNSDICFVGSEAISYSQGTLQGFTALTSGKSSLGQNMPSCSIPTLCTLPVSPPPSPSPPGSQMFLWEAALGPHSHEAGPLTSQRDFCPTPILLIKA